MLSPKRTLGLIGASCLLIYGLTWVPWLVIRSHAAVVSDVEQLSRADVAIVFGGLHQEGQLMSETNTERLLTTKVLLDRRIVERIRVSNTAASASAMKDFLVQRGVDASKIEVDGSAVVTEDTCVSEQRDHPEVRSVVFISHGYHLPRLEYLCEGIKGVGFPAERLRTTSRIEVPLAMRWKIRYGRYQREAIFTLMKMVGLYKSTLK